MINFPQARPYQQICSYISNTTLMIYLTPWEVRLLPRLAAMIQSGIRIHTSIVDTRLAPPECKLGSKATALGVDSPPGEP